MELLSSSRPESVRQRDAVSCGSDLWSAVHIRWRGTCVLPHSSGPCADCRGDRNRANGGGADSRRLIPASFSRVPGDQRHPVQKDAWLSWRSLHPWNPAKERSQESGAQKSVSDVRLALHEWQSNVGNHILAGGGLYPACRISGKTDWGRNIDAERQSF